MKNFYLFVILSFLFINFQVETRPGMGGSYRSSSGSSSSGSGTSSPGYEYKSFNRTSSSNNSNSKGNVIYTSPESTQVTVPDSPVFHLRLKILKNGDIEVREEFQLDPQKIHKPIHRVDADILRGLMSGQPQDRQDVLREYLSAEKNILSYTIPKAFHPIYGNTIGYVFFEQPANLKNYSLFIEQEDGMDAPEIQYWLSSDGGSNHLGTMPFNFYNSEENIEIGKLYEFTPNQYKYSIFLYIQYKSINSSPFAHELEIPNSYQSNKAKIELGKTKITSIDSEIHYKKEDDSLSNYHNSIRFPKNIQYENSNFDSGLLPYLFRKEPLIENFYSFHGDWESDIFSNHKSVDLNASEGVLHLSYDTYGNFKEFDDKIEFEFHIPFIPFKEFKAYLKSFDLEVTLPEGANDTNTRFYLYSARSEYTYDSDPSIILLPVKVEGNSRVFKIITLDPFVGPGRLVLNMETDKSLFSHYPGLHVLLLTYSGIRNPFSPAIYEWFLPIFFLFLTPIIIVRLTMKRLVKKDFKDSKSLEMITKIDSNFNINEFDSISRKIAFVLQDSWNKGTMKNARPFLSAGLYSRMNVQLDLLLNKDGVVNRMDDFSVESIEVKDCSTTNDYETIHLLMYFIAKDITFPKNTPETVIQSQLKSSKFTRYSEIYSFQRKIGTMTNPGKHLITGNCPSCGSPADYSHYSLKCDHCGNIYNSGEKDWVLSEITQISEWKESSNKKSSPFNTQVLEDRASALFWKFLRGKVYGKQDYIRRESSPKFIQKSNFSKQDIFIPVVGGVELIHCIKKNFHYEAKFQIMWSASDSRDHEPTGRISEMVLVKDLALEEKGFSENICSSCGAPFPESDSLKCDYCESSIPEKVNDWLLESIEQV